MSLIHIKYLQSNVKYCYNIYTTYTPWSQWPNSRLTRTHKSPWNVFFLFIIFTINLSYKPFSCSRGREIQILCIHNSNRQSLSNPEQKYLNIQIKQWAILTDKDYIDKSKFTFNFMNSHLMCLFSIHHNPIIVLHRVTKQL